MPNSIVRTGSPVENIIRSFPDKGKLLCIVPIYPVGQPYIIKDIKFFGTREQVDQNLINYPNHTIVSVYNISNLNIKESV